MNLLEIGQAIFVTVGRFLFDYGFYIYPVLLVLPPIAYVLIARPGFRDGKWIVYLGGLAMLATYFVPVFGMPHVAYLIIWLFLMPVLLIADAVVWLISAFRKKSFMVGGICTAVTLIVSGILLGNWVSILGAAVCLIALLLYWKLFE